MGGESDLTILRANPGARGAALGVAAAVLVAVLATFGTVDFAEATASVPPATYAATVCGAVATLHAKTVASEAPLQAATQAYRDQPTPDMAMQLRQAFVDYLQQTRASFSDAAAAIEQSGVPAGKNGAAFARALNDNIKTAAAALDPLIQQAGAIDVTSTTAFAAGVQNVVARLAAASESSKKQARQAAAFNHAPAALHRIVSYARGSGDTCPAR